MKYTYKNDDKIQQNNIMLRVVTNCLLYAEPGIVEDGSRRYRFGNVTNTPRGSLIAG